MTPSYMIVRKVFRMYCDRHRYAYFYGAKGELLTDEKMTELINTYWKEYYNRYTAKQLEEFKRFSLNKIGYDCSGLITALTGKQGYSVKLYEDTIDKTTPENGKAGYLLYKRGHVGVDIGYGFSLSIGSMGSSIEIAKIQDVGYTNSGAFRDYDYNDANNH